MVPSIRLLSTILFSYLGGFMNIEEERRKLKCIWADLLTERKNNARPIEEINKDLKELRKRTTELDIKIFEEKKEEMKRL